MTNLSDSNRKSATEIEGLLSNALYRVNAMEVAPIKTHHLVVSCLVDATHELKVVLDLNASRQDVYYGRMFKKLYRHLLDACEYMEKFKDVYGSDFVDVSKCVELTKGVVDWIDAVATPL